MNSSFVCISSVGCSSPDPVVFCLCCQGAEVSLKELDSLIKMLAEKKQHVQQEEAEVNMEILMDFLEKSRRQKQEQLDEVRHAACPAQRLVTWASSLCLTLDDF